MNDHEHGPAHSHSHAHDHAHAHARGHAHGIGAHHGGTVRALTGALIVTSIVLVAEVAGGIAFSSLALLGDAVHMLTDVAAYIIALVAAVMARRPPSEARTYGLVRGEIIAALVNGAALIAASAWILYEATQRLMNPLEVAGTGVAIVATIGLVANLLAMWMLTRGDTGNLNVRAAVLHTAADAASSVGVLIAGVAIAITGVSRIDPIVSYAITVLILVGALRLVREAVDVLLEAVPRGVDTRKVAQALLADDAVREVHDLHVWTLGPGHIALSAHVRVVPNTDTTALVPRLDRMLRETFSINHATLQTVEDAGLRSLDAVGPLPVAEAAEWATDHIARAHPHLSRAAISAAAGAAILECGATDTVSPVRVSVRTLHMLGLSPGGE